MVHYYEKKGQELISHEEIVQGCWINISPPFNIVELEVLSERLEIPIDFLTDSLDIDERSRFEIEDDAKLIVINTPILNEKADEPTLYITAPIGIIIVPNHIITITSYETPILQNFINLRTRNFHPHDRSLFALEIMEQSVYHYLRCLKDINVRRGIIEQEVFESSRNQDLKKLLELEKSLVYFVTALSSNSVLMNRLQRMDVLQVRGDEEKEDLLSDVIIDNNQAQEMANIYSNILNGTMDALASMISNNLNEVMQRLTLITIILMVPTLVASFYGMNVALPFQDHPYAFLGLLGVAVFISVFVAVFFRSKRWF